MFEVKVQRMSPYRCKYTGRPLTMCKSETVCVASFATYADAARAADEMARSERDSEPDAPACVYWRAVVRGDGHTIQGLHYAALSRGGREVGR